MGDRNDFPDTTEELCQQVDGTMTTGMVRGYEVDVCEVNGIELFLEDDENIHISGPFGDIIASQEPQFGDTVVDEQTLRFTNDGAMVSLNL